MFSGSIPAVITPFSQNLEVDYDCLGNHIDFLISEGSHGLVSCGTTGESPTLNHDEHKAVTEFIIKRSKGRVPVMAGCGSNSTQESIDFVNHAYKSGANATLLVTPYYNKPTQIGLYEHFKSISEASILDKAKSALSDAFDNAFTKEGRDAYYENYKAKYDTASHPFSRGVESVLTAREQQAFDNAVSSGNSSVARHYAIINQARAKLKSAVESGMTKEEMRGIGLSSFDIERGMRLYKKKPKTEETPVVSGVQETIDQTGSTFVPTSDAQPSVQTDIVAGLGSQGYRSEEDIIEKQREAAREAAAAERRKDRRREKRKAEAKKAADKRKKAITKAKSISKSVKGKGAKAISASKSKSSGPFAKGGLASRRK